MHPALFDQPEDRRHAVVVCLDRRRRALEGDAFDDVGINGALDQKIDMADLLALFFKNPDEFLADDLALALRFGDAFQCAQEFVSGIDGDEFSTQTFPKCRSDLRTFIRAQETRIHEHADQLIPDGFVNQRRRDR